jgi:hypothetical protein
MVDVRNVITSLIKAEQAFLSGSVFLITSRIWYTNSSTITPPPPTQTTLFIVVHCFCQRVHVCFSRLLSLSSVFRQQLIWTVYWVEMSRRCDRRSVSQSWCRAPLCGPWPDFIFSFLLPENCFALRLGAPSLTRGRVCNLYCNLSVVRVAEDS